MKRRLTFLFLSLVTAISMVGLSFAELNAAEPNTQQEQPLRVVTKSIEPFVIKDQDRLTGFSIDLWQEIALVTGLPFEFVEVETVSDQLDSLTTGDGDVAIAAISMTPEREVFLDFSYPYYRSGLQIMASSRSTDTLGRLISLILSPRLLVAIGFWLLLLLLVGHLVWLLERNENPDFSKNYWAGIWDGLWWSAVTVTTVGYGDKKIKDVLGRIVGIIWMFSGIFLIANFTAFITTEMTVAELNGSISGVEDLSGKRVATVAGTTSATYLRENRIPFRGVDVVEDAYELLENGQIDAIVYDAPVLQYYAATAGSGELIVVGSPFKREDYGIAFPPGSPYEEQINKALLEIKANGTYREISNRWFISEDG